MPEIKVEQLAVPEARHDQRQISIKSLKCRKLCKARIDRKIARNSIK